MTVIGNSNVIIIIYILHTQTIVNFYRQFTTLVIIINGSIFLKI